MRASYTRRTMVVGIAVVVLITLTSSAGLDRDLRVQDPTPTPSLTVLTVRDTGCPDDVRENNTREDGKEGILGETTLRMHQLGDVYHRAGRWAPKPWPDRYQSRAPFAPEVAASMLIRRCKGFGSHIKPKSCLG